MLQVLLCAVAAQLQRRTADVPPSPFAAMYEKKQQLHCNYRVVQPYMTPTLQQQRRRRWWKTTVVAAAVVVVTVTTTTTTTTTTTKV